MIGYALAATVLTLFGISRARARSRGKRKSVTKGPSWETQVVYPGPDGVETVWITRGIPQAPTSYTVERSSGDLVLDTRHPKTLDNALDLAADIASERVIGDDPTVRIDLFRYDLQEYVRRVILTNFGTTQDGRAIAQAEISERGRVTATRNYAAPTVVDVVHLFLRSQLEQTWNEGLFA